MVLAPHTQHQEEPSLSLVYIPDADVRPICLFTISVSTYSVYRNEEKLKEKKRQKLMKMGFEAGVQAAL